jgi:hypothetical protein
MHNHSEVTGTVNGGIDTRDLYRFDVTRRSALTLRLAGEPTLKLLRENGRGVGGGLIDRTIAAGRYFVAVEGSGRYTLRLDLRTITVAAMSFNGRLAVRARLPAARVAWQIRGHVRAAECRPLPCPWNVPGVQIGRPGRHAVRLPPGGWATG